MDISPVGMRLFIGNRSFLPHSYLLFAEDFPIQPFLGFRTGQFS